MTGSFLVPVVACGERVSRELSWFDKVRGHLSSCLARFRGIEPIRHLSLAINRKSRLTGILHITLFLLRFSPDQSRKRDVMRKQHKSRSEHGLGVQQTISETDATSQWHLRA